MSRYGGPKLPKSLLDQVTDGRVSKKRHDLSRKDRRKQERLTRKSVRSQPRSRPQSFPRDEESEDDLDEESQIPSPPPKVKRATKEAKSTTKSVPKQKLPTPEESEDEDEEEEEEEEEEEQQQHVKPAISRSVKRKLEDDDAEIAALEKKLGIKGKKSKKVGDDELDWLVGGSAIEDEDVGRPIRPEDHDWLRKKRRKASKIQEEQPDDEESDTEVELNDEGSEAEDDLDGIENPFSDDEISGDDMNDFGGFEDEDEQPVAPAPKRQRENPYVAPVSQDAPAAKYIPPSMRKAAASDEEVLKQLRRQLQGQLNRLSEANMISILQAVQDFYSRNARQHVTSTLIDLLQSLVCDAAVLNDTFLIFHAGFSAALYRTLGTDFGAQLLESLVLAFDNYHSRQNLSMGEGQTMSEGKQTLNLLAFLSYLYVLNAISSEVIFDYVKMLLDKENFSEANTELLLRVIRVAGPQLRQDDPTSLKDIVLLLQRTISAIGEDNVSVRTKFMIETIQNLKNNRMKTGVAASALSAEHMQRMKKTLSSIKSVKANEPLHITLADIRDSEKKGKWWLVGASYRDPAKMASNRSQPSKVDPIDEDAQSGADSDGSEAVNLDKLARAQGMNTEVRRAIFVAAAGAVDYQHAHMRIMKLNLKNKQQIEIPRVLLHCITAEPVYNHYYTLVATQFCSDHKLRKAWQFALLGIFRRLGDDGDGPYSDDESNDSELTVPKIYNLGKLYATLIAENLLRISALKAVNVAKARGKTSVFLNTLMTTLFISLRKKARKDGFENAVKETFAQAHAVPDMVSGLKFYVTSIIPAAGLAANKKEAKVIEQGCDFAAEALVDAGRNNVTIENDLTSDEE